MSESKGQAFVKGKRQRESELCCRYCVCMQSTSGAVLVELVLWVLVRHIGEGCAAPAGMLGHPGDGAEDR